MQIHCWKRYRKNALSKANCIPAGVVVDEDINQKPRSRKYGKIKETEGISLFHYSPIKNPRSVGSKIKTNKEEQQSTKPKIKIFKNKQQIVLKGRSAIIARTLSAAEYQKGLKKSRKT
ncbi:MAG: hypothetical protein AABY26_00760 [Nanoarchaeota archaeon]